MSGVLTAADREALALELAQFEHDPLGFVLWDYPWGVPGTELATKRGPRLWQRELLEEIGEHLRNGATVHQVLQLARVSGHGIGKSTVVAWLINWAIKTREDARGVVTANTEGQLRTKTWPEVAKWHRISLFTRALFKCTATALYSSDPDHEKNWRVDATPWSEHNTEAFAGLHNEGKRILLIFDEASKIADKVWEVAEGALTDEHTEIVWAVFGNGTRANGRFRECFRRFRHRWQGRHIDSRTVEGTNKQQLEKWVADYGEDSDFVKVRVRGMFPAASPKQFISETDVDAAAARHLRPEQYRYAAKILTCDPAWSGDDELVIALRQGLYFKVLLTMPKNDNDVFVANQLMRLEDELQADAVFIDAGFGTGIYSAGAALGRTWILVWFSESGDDEGDLNKRSSMWRNMRDWTKSGGAIDPEDHQLRQDLTGPETKPRVDGKLQLESKEDMKLRGLPSPNRADALALSFAHPVLPKMATMGRGRGMTSEYDPYADQNAIEQNAGGGMVSDYDPYR